MPNDQAPTVPSRNRLGEETSPYLLQHKDNPVHWWAWGPQALAEAKRTGKPILLSVGYAACHWCHVMAHESFENTETAALMNALYINIKVDREERPDIDAIYMSALHRLGEQGGWPLTMFLDTDARPFFGGTYYPPESRYGRPSFSHVLREISRVWTDEPHKVTQNAEGLTAALRAAPEAGPAVRIDDDMLRGIAARLTEAVDETHGGMRGAPKFPQWSIFWLLWRSAIRHRSSAARQAMLTTLTRICQGGIYDHLGGGFARYSVDELWLVPHFEKMLYDNALLLDLVTEAWRETHDPLFAARIEETVGWLVREMVAEGGGFASSLDADSEGEEGRFYVWSYDQVMELLGPGDGDLFCNVYDVSPAGNFEGHTILNRLHSIDPLSTAQEDRLASLRTRLFQARDARVRPGWDDKVLADWNGLMIASLAKASRALARPQWLDLAGRAFRFVVERMIVDGKLVHAHRAGQSKAPATSSDYANLIRAAIHMHEATGQARYLQHAIDWTAVLDRDYWHHDAGGYCMTASDTPDVIVRLRAATDDATPNANAIMVTNLAHLGLLTGESRWHERAHRILDAFAADLQRNLVAHCGLLSSAFDLIAPQQIVIAGNVDAADTAALTDKLRSLSLPGALEMITDPQLAGDSGKPMQDGQATAYICIGPQCSPPINNAEKFAAQLEHLRSQGTGSPGT